MWESIASLFKADEFMPHGHCYLWQSNILWLNVGSDALIAASYFAIPAFLFWFYLRRRDLEFSWILVLFSLFILGCGTTHLMDIWTVWNPHYGAAGIVKAFTGGISFLTAISLSRAFPKMLALASPKQLEATNAQLRAEIAERVRAEEGWRQAKVAAEVANSAKTAFLANMSHEIRTPLGAVTGFAELLKSQDLSPEERNEIHRAIKRNSDLLLNVINDVLDLSKIEAGKVQIEKSHICLFDLVADLSSSLRLQASEKGIDFLLDTDTNLPDVIETDPVRLRQILLNVVGNALKFTDRGAIEIKISPIQTPTGELLICFVVKDSGIGICPENAQKLFEPFRQADDSTSRRYGGSGLGLVLSKRLASALGGDVQLTESVPGKGSIFTITIDSGLSDKKPPLLKKKNAAAETRQRDSHSLKGMKILLVDDSLDNQILISIILQAAGADVDTAGGGEQAIKTASATAYDVVLMDLQMPGIDGFMATREIRRRGYKNPILALTAHGFTEVKDRCLENGLVEHIIKPVDPDVLIECLMKYKHPQPRALHEFDGRGEFSGSSIDWNP